MFQLFLIISTLKSFYYFIHNHKKKTSDLNCQYFSPYNYCFQYSPRMNGTVTRYERNNQLIELNSRGMWLWYRWDHKWKKKSQDFAGKSASTFCWSVESASLQESDNFELVSHLMDNEMLFCIWLTLTICVALSFGAYIYKMHTPYCFRIFENQKVKTPLKWLLVVHSWFSGLYFNYLR